MAKTKPKSSATSAPAAAPAPLPPIEKALADVARFQIRATVGLVVRIILLGVLITLLKKQNDAWEKAASLLQAGAVVLAVWPWFTTQGRLWSGRIHLGGRYVDAGELASAAQLLQPLTRPTARVFDAGREGTFHLARALHGLHNDTEALPLLEVVAREAAPEKREQAASLLRTLKKDTRP